LIDHKTKYIDEYSFYVNLSFNKKAEQKNLYKQAFLYFRLDLNLKTTLIKTKEIFLMIF